MLAAAVCYPAYAKASAYIGRRRRVACVIERFKFRIALVLGVVFPLADVVSDGSVVRTMLGIGMIVFAGMTIFFMVVPATFDFYRAGLSLLEKGDTVRSYYDIGGLKSSASAPCVVQRITAMEKVPKTGTLQISYTCAPEDRGFAARQKLLATYGLWQRPVREEDITWWAALTEAHKDVIHFLEFLIARFKNVHDAFVAFDGVDGNGQISLREFEAGIRKLRCHKFRGADEKQRIVNIFRYLDAGEEGEVSRREWGFLESLWRELRQSIREFVGFLERTFDGRGNDFLDEAWRYLDDDKSGALELEEWETIVQGKLSYFGPCMMVFHFLDVDDGGTVSLDEFRTLEEFKDAG